MTIEDLNGIFHDMDNGKYMPDGHVQYMATCPCHPDRYKSLSILVKRNNEGQVNGLKLHCHAGCSPKEIVAAAGIPNPEEMSEKNDAAGWAVTSAEDAAWEAVMASVAAAQEIVVHDAAAEAVKEMAAAMSGQIGALAEMLRVTNERMAEMEKVIRTLEKVTPQQAGNINKAIRERAAEICQEYRMGVTVTPVEQGRGSVPERAEFKPNREKLKAVAVAIRRDVRTATGARSMQAVARCDYGTVIEMVTDWDDYEKVKAIKKGGGDR